MRIRRLLAEPLLAFLATGVGLFVLFGYVAPDDRDPGAAVIVVDREALLDFIQYRSRAFEPELAAERLDGLAGAELDRLIRDYVREEALYREALALAMDDNDYIIKQRMIQKMEFINTGFATAAADLSEDDVEAYFEGNRSDYYVDPYVTFTHVFFDAERHGRDAARNLATAKLAELNREGARFTDSPRHGDRFLYNVNYVERTRSYVASHFGETMATAIFELDPVEGQWRGPFESAYGFHLVLLTSRTDGRYPDLDEIESRVRDDARREWIREHSEQAIRAIVDTYAVRIDYPPAPPADGAGARGATAPAGAD